jgi:hypothetical protein
MRFRVVETGDDLTAVFDSGDSLHNSLLSRFLVSSKYFVVDILHDISLVERDVYPSHAYENPEVFIELFKDHITIEPYIGEGETEIPKVRIPLERAKLLLLEWGVALQRWRMERETVSSQQGLQAPKLS